MFWPQNGFWGNSWPLQMLLNQMFEVVWGPCGPHISILELKYKSADSILSIDAFIVHP